VRILREPNMDGVAVRSDKKRVTFKTPTMLILPLVAILISFRSVAAGTIAPAFQLAYDLLTLPPKKISQHPRVSFHAALKLDGRLGEEAPVVTIVSTYFHQSM